MNPCRPAPSSARRPNWSTQHDHQPPAPALEARLTVEEIRAVWVEHGLDDEAVEDFARAIESTLLSKLRAPVADDLAQRLRCKYALGPMIDGEPEFGWRDYSGPAPEGMRLPSPIMLEAADAIERMRAALSAQPGAQEGGSDA